MGSEQVFRLNSLFDPNFTGGGHQPQGFDQLTPIYGKYLIKAVEVELTFTNPNADGLFVAFMLQSSVGTYTLTGKDTQTIDELQQVETGMINSTGSQVLVLKTGRVPIHVLEGIAPTQLRDSIISYGADVTANPSSTPFVRIAAGSMTGTQNDNCQVMCRLVYHGEFYDRKMQAQS